jgi:bifunctional DNA-binding transcriptional regulator/antitoxin component of YhaV-PrlF toxin-antitoxin module/predicted DNA-binding protein YlxM (UPF0122 family)
MVRFKHLSLDDRKSIEHMVKQKVRIEEIADSLSVSHSTIYREIKRGCFNGAYNAEYAEKQYRENMNDKGRMPKLLRNKGLANFISHCILERCLSPEQIVNLIKAGKTSFSAETITSTATIYTAIDKGYVPDVTRETMATSRKATMFNKGCIIIPKKLRSLMNFNDGDVFDIEYIEGSCELILKKSIAAMKGEATMSDKEKFEGFKQNLIDENERQYGAEVRANYGNQAVDESNANLKGLTQEQYDEGERLRLAMEETLKAAFDIGDPAGELAQKAADLHRQWLCVFYPKYSKEYHMGLGEMYVADERFRANYDKLAPNCTEFLRDAINVYCKLVCEAYRLVNHFPFDV